MNKLFIEFFGTFILVLTVGCTVLGAVPGVIAPLAIGAALAAVIYAGGYISSAHYNPAVTVAAVVRGAFDAKGVLGYWAAQILAAVLAAFAAMLITGKSGTPMEFTNVAGAFVAEFIFTFTLAYVILGVATSKSTSGNSFYGIAIALVVVSGAFAVGHVSGGVFNPAVAVGGAIMGLFKFADLWPHLIAQFAGGALAGVAFRWVDRPSCS